MQTKAALFGMATPSKRASRDRLRFELTQFTLLNHFTSILLMIVNSTQFDGVAFVGRTSAPISELTGFDRKRHKIPQQSDDRSDHFVAAIANVDLENCLESDYQKLRKAFKFKRVDLARSNPAPGCGAIETPHFIYALNVSHCPNSPNSVLWERSVIEIKNPDEISTPAFAEVFDGMFDRIEFTLTQPFELTDWIDHIESMEDDRLELSYDSQVTYCRLEIDNINATIEIVNSVVAVAHQDFASTAEILASFLEFKKTIVSSFGRSA